MKIDRRFTDGKVHLPVAHDISFHDFIIARFLTAIIFDTDKTA